MGGSRVGSRRAEIGSELDSYISNVRKRKPFCIAQKKKSWSIWPFSSEKGEVFATDEIIPARPSPGIRSPAANDERASFWEGIKTSMRDTVRRDLERINKQQQGGNNMRQDDDFIDFEDGGLKVVPIPDEDPTPKATPTTTPINTIKAKPTEQTHIMIDPFADEPIKEEKAAKKNPGFFSRLFARKTAAKEEAKMDKDFLTEAKPAASAAPIDLELKDDFKELAKLFLKSLERMNKEQLNSFKSTDDFARFKTLLKKHSVIK